jgi:hypothetical protein
VKKVVFFPNGQTAVFDEQGQQMPELQRSWLKLFADFLDDHDEDPTEFEFTMPDGRVVKVLETESGWNWTVS